MSPPLFRLVATLVAFVALVAACGADSEEVEGAGATDAVEDGEVPREVESDAVVVSVENVGAFTTAESSYQTLPSVVVYGDGSRLTPADTTMIHPAPALVSIESSQLTAAQVTEIVAEASDVGLDAEIDYGEPPVADAGTTVVTVTIDGATFVHAAPALGIVGDGLGLSDEQVAARRSLESFVADVESLVGSDPEPYRPERYRLWVRSAEGLDTGAPVDEDSPAPDVVAWSVDSVVLVESRCVPVESGADAAAVTDVLAGTDSLTRVQSDGSTWAVVARPVLPHETTCPE